MKFSLLVITVAVIHNSAASPVPQEDAGCPSFCPAVYAAVCGTDGKTYDSECQLKSTACKTEKTIFVDYEGDCVQSSGQQQQQSTTEKSCNGNCDREYEPVCGSDGKTYNNVCFLEFTDCQAGPGDKIRKVADGPCPTGGDERQGKSAQIDDDAAEEEAEEEFVEEKPVTNPPVPAGCKNECAQNFKPVCGSDTKTYKNECLLDFAACENTSEKKLVKVSNGICPELTGREGPSSKDSQDVTITTTTAATPGSCNGKCNRDFKPVCGSDGVTYNNDCLLEFAACKSENGKKITKASVGRCREGRQEEEDAEKSENPFLQQTDEVKAEETPISSQTNGECNANCVREFKPICGSDGVTYNNKCLLELAACRKTEGEKISEAYTGRCREGKQISEINEKCREFKCTRELNQVCGSDGKTYNNECVLQFEACLSNSQVVVAHNGTCSSNNDQTGDVEQHGVNGQKGAVIQDRTDDEGAEVAEEPVKKPAACKPFCPLLYAPVCGSDGKTYSNECDLTSKACISKTDVTMVHVGECKVEEDEETTTAVPEEAVEAEDENPCPIECSEGQRPVCGSDGKTYANLCQLNREKCRSNGILNLAGKGPCKPVETSAVVKEEEDNEEKVEAQKPGIESCARFCTLEFAPLCGSDGKTYSNVCLLEVENCKAEIRGEKAITKVHDKSCEPVEEESN